MPFVSSKLCCHLASEDALGWRSTPVSTMEDVKSCAALAALPHDRVITLEIERQFVASYTDPIMAAVSFSQYSIMKPIIKDNYTT